MTTPIAPGPGAGVRRLLNHISRVLDPIAERHAGTDPQELKLILQKAWRAEFRTELREPALSRCAAALSTQRPWALALWSNDWP